MDRRITDPLTKENNVHAFTLKLLHTLLPRLDIPIVRIVNDDLTSLHREEIPDLVLYLGLYATPEGVGRFGSGCWGCQRRRPRTTSGFSLGSTECLHFVWK